jgi:hypothetical protein
MSQGLRGGLEVVDKFLEKPWLSVVFFLIFQEKTLTG